MLNKLLNNGKYTEGIIKFEDYCSVYFVKSNNCRNPNQEEVGNTNAKSNQRRTGTGYALTREKFLVRVNKLSPIRAEDWNRYLDNIFELILKDEALIYETKMNAYLEETVAKYLYPCDDYISLTEIARKFDSENPSYLIQSWLRSRNTVVFLATWEQNNNPNFKETGFQKLVVDAKTPQFTLTPKKWIDATNAIGITSEQGKGGGTMAHPFIACDFERWNDSKFRYEVLKYFMTSKIETDEILKISNNE